MDLFGAKQEVEMAVGNVTSNGVCGRKDKIVAGETSVTARRATSSIREVLDGDELQFSVGGRCSQRHPRWTKTDQMARGEYKPEPEKMPPREKPTLLGSNSVK
jgi:hypothetical protein